MRPVREPPRAETISEVAPGIVQPACDPEPWADGGGRGGAHRAQRKGVAETALVSLARSVVVGVHHHGLRTVGHAITLGAAPAGVLVILRVLQGIEKPALG